MEEKPKTEAEIEAIYESAYISDIETLREGLLISPSEQMFIWCERKGYIVLSNEFKHQVMKDVIAEYQLKSRTAMTKEDKTYYESVLNNPNELKKICRVAMYYVHVKKKSEITNS